MKNNMKKVMDNLEIEEGIRETIKKLWQHGYVTYYSCEGHKIKCRFYGWILLDGKSGDGWWEYIGSKKYNFEKVRNKDCCYSNKAYSYKNEGRYVFFKELIKNNVCGKCGAGLYEKILYKKVKESKNETYKEG